MAATGTSPPNSRSSTTWCATATPPNADPEDFTDPDEGGRDGRLVLASFERCFPLYHDSEARYSAGVVSPESSFTEG
jgi:hypothetical protein